MLRSLKQLGVADEVAAAGVAIDTAHVCAPDGTLLAALPIPKVVGPDLPAVVGITRPALHHVLWKAAERAGVLADFGKSVTDLKIGTDDVAVSFSDGEIRRYDLVVAADGGRSGIRSTIFTDAPEPLYMGQMAWRARVPRRTGPMLAAYHAPDRKAGLITVSDSDSYLFLLVNRMRPHHPTPQQLPGLLRAALAGFGGAVADIRADIIDPASIHYSPLKSVLVPRPWHRGRVVIIGDAAHATTPHLGYGAGLAVEDGVILAEELCQAPDVQTGLRRFADRRWERCRLVVENGLQLLRWELNPHTAGADPAELMRRSQLAIAAPA